MVEVTSFDRDARQRDGVDKPRACAETGISLYLVVDRVKAGVIVHSDPEGQAYRRIDTTPAGELVRLPAPVWPALDTAPLLDWIGWRGLPKIAT